MTRKNTVRWLRLAARVMLVALASFWFVFALLSGAESFGGGWRGVMLNAPNALPWLVLFVLVWVAFRWERLGGGLLVLAGGFAAQQLSPHFPLFLFLLIPLPVMAGGMVLVVCSYLEPKTGAV